jgi:hypothetical protein
MNDLNPKTQALLDSVREADGPTPRAKERVRRRVLARVAGVLLGASAGISSATSAASVAGASIGAWSTKLVVLAIAASAVVAGGATTAVVVSQRHTTHPAVSLRPAAPVTPSPPFATSPAVLPTPVPWAARPATEGETTVEPRSLAARPGAGPSRPQTSNETLEEELPLLQDAQEALRLGEIDRALSLLEVHARRFPVGALSEERRATHALAVCRRAGGASASTAAEAEAFIRESPSSPLVERVRKACLVAHP